MLRVECHDIGDSVTMRLEGRFVGEFAKDARELVTRCKIPLRLVVNLSEVTFVDVMGEEVLLWLARIGGEFVAESCYPLHVCERLHLPMAPKCAGALPERCNPFRKPCFTPSPIWRSKPATKGCEVQCEHRESKKLGRM